MLNPPKEVTAKSFQQVVTSKPVTKDLTKSELALKPVVGQKIIDKKGPEIIQPTSASASEHVNASPVIKEKFSGYQMPVAIAERANPLIKQIETEEAELVIELYDNGEIDGDTVTIYHNNQLLILHAGLSEKPVRLKIKVDKEHPHHELIMVADNLGSIPPNTSLMIITANTRRYEIFISSSEQKNAKIVIDLKE